MSGSAGLVGTSAHLLPVSKAIDRAAICETLETAFQEHFCAAPEKLKSRFYAACSPRTAGDALVHLSRVRFETHRFDFDEGGRWSIVAPIYEGGRVVDVGAFDVDDAELRRPYRLGYAVGFDLALWNAGFHANKRMLLHYGVWSWLRAECEGCLPIDWRRTAIALIEWRVAGIVYVDDDEARSVERRIYSALKPPPSFVKRKG